MTYQGRDGPLYPIELGAEVKRWRQLAMERELTHGEKIKYGKAVLAGIGKLQLKELRKRRRQ